MKHLLPFAFALSLVACAQKQADASLSIHFDEPAAIWEATFPLGNGRIGLMPDGGVSKETYVLNESSVWSGSVQDADNPEALASLPEIRKLLFEGRNDEAQQLMYRTFTCGGPGSAGPKYGNYQILSNLIIDFDEADAKAEEYRRELDLDGALATVSFKKDGEKVKREAFASFADDVAVIWLESDKPQSFSVSAERPTDGRDNRHLPVCTAENTTVKVRGTLQSGNERRGEPFNGMKYGADIRVVLPNGGAIETDGASLKVKDTKKAMILVAMKTNYRGDDIDKVMQEQIEKAAAKSYAQLKNDHQQAFREKFRRVSVDLGHKPEKEAMDMTARLQAFAKDKDDPSLASLYYQFGRYLLISSTREGALPPNLQGLWANGVRTPWNCDYHLNINLQMNMWPAEKGNLTELLLPLTDWVEQQVESGRHTAQVFYGAGGWVTHILGNLWQFTSPGEGVSWGATNTAAAWLCAHLYQHYLYTQDKDYLERIWPTMKEAAQFFVDMLVEDPRNGYLVTAPTTSPENVYILPNGARCSVCAGSTMDNQIIRELFTNVISAAGILETDAEFAETLAKKRDRLMPTAIGPDGRILEWPEPYEEAEPTHRHVSHLYGLYPANEITVLNTPELADAARKTLEARGDISTGWSMAWKMNFWARLHDGEHAFKLFTDLLRPIVDTGMNYSNGGGTYPNLFCGHPPFQIDGNFGGSAGIAEMLLQSQSGCIEFIPALPSAWKDGSVKGMCVEGGAEVDFTWKDSQLTSFTIRATQDCTQKVSLDGQILEYSLQKGQSATWQK